MSNLLAPAQLATAHLVLTALVIIWNLTISGRAARLQSTPRTMAFLCALCGLLLALSLLFPASAGAPVSAGGSAA